MGIFGALLSIVVSTSYAAIDEARSWYRISSYKMYSDDRKWDDKYYKDLTDTLKENWNYYGATLFPKKLIPFLALHSYIRDYYIHSIVMQIMNINNVTSTFINDPGEHVNATDMPYGLSAGAYGNVFPGRTPSGPSVYEYDFVRQTQPEDWKAYTSAEERREIQLAKESAKESKDNMMLVLLGIAMFTAVALLLFLGVPCGWFSGMSAPTYKIVVTIPVCVAASPFFIVLRRKSIPIPPGFWIFVLFGIICVLFV